jgi:pilus assembly protein CpaE
MSGERGQASIEFLGALPAVLLAAAVCLQLLAIGYTAVLAGNAAEAGALALARGRGAAGATGAARGSVPGWARNGARVVAARGLVRVTLRPPSLIPRAGSLVPIHASAAVAGP